MANEVVKPVIKSSTIKPVNKNPEKEFFGTKKEWVIMKNPFPQIGGEYSGAVDVIAKDESGYYLTHSNYVGTGLLDPYRMYRKHPISETDLELYTSNSIKIENE